MNKKELIILVLMLVAITTRFIFLVDGQSVIPNFTAVGAIAILGASHLRGIKKWALPLVVLWGSDLLLNNITYAQYYDSFQVFGSMWVYGGFMVVGLVAYYLLKNASWGKLLATSIIGAVLFFLITNFGVWASAVSPYPKDISGLMSSYVAGVPFFRNALLANVCFSFVLFGAYEYLAAKLNDIEPMMNTKVIVTSP